MNNKNVFRKKNRNNITTHKLKKKKYRKIIALGLENRFFRQDSQKII